MNQILEELTKCVLEKIQKRLSQINYEKEQYRAKIIKQDDLIGIIDVSYKGYVFYKIKTNISHNKVNGHESYFKTFSIRAISDDWWYDAEKGLDKIKIEQVDETLSLDKLDVSLEKNIPLSKEEEVEQIKEELGTIKLNDDIKYDTYTHRYVVDVDLWSYVMGNKEIVAPDILYKYMSLDTYMKILSTNKIRLNSLVSMNDTSEGFFIGDTFCRAYDDIRGNSNYMDVNERSQGMRNKFIVENKNILIGCFSELFDNALMWRLYGDEGRGVCLGLKIDKSQLRPIAYLSDKGSNLTKLSGRLKQNGIHIELIDSQNDKYYFKSKQFEYEKEWRFIKKESNDIHYTMYGNVISYYNDYEMKKLGLEPVILTIGRNLPHKDVNFPLLVDLTRRELGIKNINLSSVDKLRV